MVFGDSRTHSAALGAAAALGPGRRVQARVRARVEAFLGSGSVAWDRNFLFVRPAIAVAVAVAVMMPGTRIPGREGVLAACAAAIVFNFAMVPIVLGGHRYLTSAITIVADNGVVIVASLYVFMRMGQAGYESDLWMLYPCLIVTNATQYGPIGSAVFAMLWTGLFVFESKWFYPAGSYTANQMTMRLVFFVLTSVVAFSLAGELRSRANRLGQKTRQTLSMLAMIVEARDTDAGLHLQHIERYAHALALRLGLDPAEAREVAYAAMIHDVGKAQVPDAILKKPGALTAGERREMEKHTVWADTVLAGSDEFATARCVARWHHERYDGTGYPDGLAGEEIPLAARIVAVADVYDALASKRPYKPAWPVEEAIAEIVRLSGTHLDPDVVKALVELYDRNILRDLDGARPDTGLSSPVAEAA